MHRLIQQTPSPVDNGNEGEDDRGPAAPIAANDRELLMRFCTRGDEAAFAELVERHSGLVWVAVWQVLRHRQDVEDAFQATFLILARRSATIRGRDSIAGWLHRVAFRTALAVRRKRGDAKPLNGEADTLVAPEAEQLAAIGAHEERSLLLEELRALPERYQLPITLCYLEQRTRGEAADELGLSVAAVKGRLARGKQMLRARLARRGVGLSTAVAALAAPLAEAQAAVATGATAALAAAANGSAPGGVSGGGLEGVSQTAIQIAHQGAKAMALNALMKPAAAVFVAATLGVAGLVAGEPEDQPVAGVAPDHAINLQAAATELSPPTPPVVAGFTAPAIVDEKVLQAGPQVQPPATASDFTADRPKIEPVDIVVQGPGQWASRPAAPTPPVVPVTKTGRKRLELELDHWRLRAEGLNRKAEAEEMRADVIGQLMEKTGASEGQRVDAISARAEAILLRADAKLAEAKAMELEEKLKQPTASVTFPQGADPRLYAEAGTVRSTSPQRLAVGDRIIAQFQFQHYDEGRIPRVRLKLDEEGRVNVLSGLNLPRPIDGVVMLAGYDTLEAARAIERHLAKELPENPVRVTVERIGDRAIPTPAEPLGRQSSISPPAVPTPPQFPPSAVFKTDPTPHRITVGDQLLVRAMGTFPEQPLDGPITVEASGTLPLGPAYGRVNVVGMTLVEAEKAIIEKLAEVLNDVDVQVTLLRAAGRAKWVLPPGPQNYSERAAYRSWPTASQQLTRVISAKSDAEEEAISSGHEPVRIVLGPRLFREGDSIEITRVLASSPRLEPGDSVVVSGRVRLSSRDAGDLSLYLTQTESRVGTKPDAAQILRMERGVQEFTLKKTIRHRGALHITFYDPASGKPFGGVYFGTKEQMESIAEWDLSYYLDESPASSSESARTSLQNADTRPRMQVIEQRQGLSAMDRLVELQREKVEAVRVEVQKLRESSRQVQLDLQRRKELHKEGIESEHRLQAAQAKLHEAQSRVASVEAKLKDAEIDLARAESEQSVTAALTGYPGFSTTQPGDARRTRQVDHIAEFQAQLDAREASLKKQVQNLKAELSKRDTELQKRDAELAKRQVELQKREIEEAKQRAELQKRGAEKAKEQSQTQTSTAATEKLKAELAKLQAELAKREEQIRQLKEAEIK